MLCPQCKARMVEGHVPTGGGQFFFRKEHRDGFFPFARALPGTSSWFRRARLEAYHCLACQLVLFRYGKQYDSEEPIDHH